MYTAPSRPEFQSTLSSRRATPVMVVRVSATGFQSTLSSRRATNQIFSDPGHWTISIHALLTESDVIIWQDPSPRQNFNPRSPHGERLVDRWGKQPASEFQSTLSSRRATGTTFTPSMRRRYFNPRSPHGERQAIAPVMRKRHQEFQSTLSSRRATRERRTHDTPQKISIHALLTESDLCPFRLPFPDFLISIHALLTESDMVFMGCRCIQRISIHALLTESDETASRYLLYMVLFQSTLSSRRATKGSIGGTRLDMNFNPRSPHGERHRLVRGYLPAQRFQSTLSSRRATVLFHRGYYAKRISIHALLTESDLARMVPNCAASNFNPRSPHGERRH